MSGTVINTEQLKDKVRIDLVCDQGKDKVSVFVELTAAARCVEPFSSVSLQNEWVLWTPESRPWRDYKLKKIGESFKTPESGVVK